MDYDLTPQTKKGTPLYEHLMMVNPEHSSEPHSKVQIGISEAHSSGIIEILSDAMTWETTP